MGGFGRGMKRKKHDEDVTVIRTTASAFEEIKKNKTKGLFYYCEDGEYILIDNRQGKMVQSKYKSLSELAEDIA